MRTVITLFSKIGRTPARPLISVDEEDPGADAKIMAAQIDHINKCKAGGSRDPEFYTSEHDGEDDVSPENAEVISAEVEPEAKKRRFFGTQ